MRVRQPVFDFSKTKPRWAKSMEFAMGKNGLSITIPPLERFLNRVMAKARSQIKGDDPASVQLRADISTFIKQESVHYATHEGFNRAVSVGFDRIPELEAKVEAHYTRMLEKRSLAFCVAYCEGFETLGPLGAHMMINAQFGKLLEGADPNVTMLFRWHAMEEFEHRSVVYRTFKRIHGGYFMRVGMFFYQMYWFAKLSGMVTKYMLEVERAKMTPEEVAESKRREKAIAKLTRKSVLGYLPKALSPWYDPDRLPIPTGFNALERQIDDEWMGAKAVPQPA